LRFGLDVLLHLLRYRHAYDVVHTCSFPYFPMMLAAAVARLGGPPVVTDWIEVWPPDYWNRYLGRYGGWIGAMVQRLCIALTDRSFTFADSTAEMLRRCGYRKDPVIIRGMFADEGTQPDVESVRAPLVVFVGRHIREKHVTAIPAAILRARETIPDLRAVIFGDGPERPRLLEKVARLGLERLIECPGFVDWTVIDDALRHAICLLLPSEREGYGLVVLEAAARGTPAIIVAGPNNAAADFVEDGVNGYRAADAGPVALARAIIEVSKNAASLRRSTAAWFERFEPTFTIESSIVQIEQIYRAAVGASASQRM
jgi:glycosyltransferase involved in cell wall biosynthesis